MRNIIFCAQFHELSGYSIAALGYLEALDTYLERDHDTNNIKLKVLSVSQDKELILGNIKSGNISDKNLRLIEKYHIKTNAEFQEICSETYDLIWQMTSILPCIMKATKTKTHKSLEIEMEDLIKGSQENYHILAWETNKLPIEYLEQIKKYDPASLIAPSAWNCDTFNKDHRALLVPHVIPRTELSTTSEIAMVQSAIEEGKFVILSVSEWSTRKNFQALIRSYIAQFHKHRDTLLVIKTTIPRSMSRGDFVKEIRHLKAGIRTHDLDENKENNIAFIVDYLNDDKMNYLYKACDLYVLTSYGEGFSLPTSRAAIEGKAIVCPDRGGHIDFISRDNPFFIDTIEESVFSHPPYDFDGNWYYPSLRSTMTKLKEAYFLWKNDNDKFKSIGEANARVASDYHPYSIAKKLIRAIEPAGGSLPQLKSATLKKKIANAPLQQKIDLLRGQYKNQECYILNCGPSLLDYDTQALKDYLKDKLVFTVKQAYELFSEVSDFHFFNCSNLPQQQNIYSGHYRNSKDCVFVASSNYEEYQRWNQLQTSDIFFKIPIRTEVNNEFLTRTGDIDKYLLKNNLIRPCGPGIMYETVLFMAIHLGVKKITCLGWDLSQDKVEESTYKHFYGNTEGLQNRGDILKWEIEETRKFSLCFYNWLKSRNIEMNIASQRSYLPAEIPRIRLFNK